MNIKAAVQLTISMAIFGTIGFFTIKTGIPALELVFIRCICATLFLVAIWGIAKGYKIEAWSKKEIVTTLFCGIFLVLNWVFLFKAFEEMNISIAISIYNLAPIFVLIFGTLFLKEKLNLVGLIAIVVCFLGSVLIIGIEQFTSIESLFTSGFVWAILSAICYALTVIISRNVKQLSAYVVTVLQTIVGVVILLPFVDFNMFQNLTTENWLYILGTGFIHTGFVYYLFFNSIRALPTVVTSALVFVDPLVAILLDIILLAFMPSVLQVVGILLIFGGIIYTLVKPPQKIKL